MVLDKNSFVHADNTEVSQEQASALAAMVKDLEAAIQQKSALAISLASMTYLPYLEGDSPEAKRAKSIGEMNVITARCLLATGSASQPVPKAAPVRFLPRRT